MKHFNLIENLRIEYSNKHEHIDTFLSAIVAMLSGAKGRKTWDIESLIA
jgi:hypothetical protein